MRTLEIPAFDSLRGEDTPSRLFGPVLNGLALEKAQAVFADSRTAAEKRVESGFGIDFEIGPQVAGNLDRLVDGMWGSDWDPGVSDLNLFATDFGLLFAGSLLHLSNSTLAVRSATTPNHHSIWFGCPGHEYFPFHKAMKCLTQREGESFDSMYRAAKQSSGYD